MGSLADRLAYVSPRYLSAADTAKLVRQELKRACLLRMAAGYNYDLSEVFHQFTGCREGGSLDVSAEVES